MGSEATNARASDYLHGTTPEEQARLSKLNEILNEASVRELRLGGGERILDVGCGLAQLTRRMARTAGATGCVVGIERSEEQIAEARRQAVAAGQENLVDLRQGDVFAMPLRDDEWGTFDVAHARFLLEHVPDPLTVVRSMVRAARLGGRVVLEDDDHEVIRLWPEPAGFTALWNAYMRVYERLGYDPIVGRRLVELLHQAGAAPARNTWIFFGSCAGGADFEAYVENLIGILEGAKEKMLNFGLLDARVFERSVAGLRDWKHRPDAALWFATAWAEGVRPGSFNSVTG
jgi:ubiquinone/menaquinone biosynthesis C-methylase UbiE